MAKSSDLLVTERELIQRLSVITGHNKEVVRDVIKAQFEFVIDELSNGIPVRIGNLGEFHVNTRLVNGGYDFAKRQMKPLKEGIQVKFNVSSGVKKAVKAALLD